MRDGLICVSISHIGTFRARSLLISSNRLEETAEQGFETGGALLVDSSATIDIRVQWIRRLSRRLLSVEGVDTERHGKGTTSRKRPKWSRDNEAATLKDSEDALAVTNKYRHVVLRRLADANISCPSDSPIHATKFDRTGRLLLTAGLDGHARIFVQEV